MISPHRKDTFHHILTFTPNTPKLICHPNSTSHLHESSQKRPALEIKHKRVSASASRSIGPTSHGSVPHQRRAFQRTPRSTPPPLQTRTAAASSRGHPDNASPSQTQRKRAGVLATSYL
ncbi:hypothetical protein WMY93_011480 [Mugilogobius chulae]|uniref:Uncharacterized protein n=1 Tax=Mugilogobius chulae TaxID=88201 RepID=A0AAW0PCR0_9GOBI